MADIEIRINGKDTVVPENLRLIDAAEYAAENTGDETLRIDSLYYLKGIVNNDDSGVCIAENKKDGSIVNATEIFVTDGDEFETNSEKVITKRKEALEKIFAIYHIDTKDYGENPKTELEHLYKKYNMKGVKTLTNDMLVPVDYNSLAFTRNPNKCIRCKRCVYTCGNVQNTGALGMDGEGLDAVIGPKESPFLEDFSLGNRNCVFCGQCVAVCPAGALTPKDDTAKVKAAIADNDKFVVIQVAPAVRTALGEEFGMPVGTDVEKKIPEAFRKLGFDKVFDTKFGADLTIVEEAEELIERIKTGGTLPLITSCCPGWVKFCEDRHQTLLANLSSCKAPHTMEGAIVKSYFSMQTGIPKQDIVVVSLMPCTAKKFEITREDECGTGFSDVDIAITTREAADMLKAAGINLSDVPEGEFDNPLGQGTGAGVIFGATGGVMEAALRTAADRLTGEELTNLEYTDVRGFEGTKEASYKIGNLDVKVAVVSGLANADELLKSVEKQKTKYHFIEVMACPGGCINGGGQPYQTASAKNNGSTRNKRATVLYKNDESSAIRKSHENPGIIRLYEEYLLKPGSEKAHKLLHTTYKVR